MFKKIMIVEDETETRGFITKSLKRKKFDIVEAQDGQDALEKLKKCQPNLIILDVNMPNLNGFEFLKIIKSNPKTRKIPVIMLTVKKDTKDLDTGINLGADFYLPKPFTLENLTRFINLTLGKG